jgi:hypothetical protein
MTAAARIMLLILGLVYNKFLHFAKGFNRQILEVKILAFQSQIRENIGSIRYTWKNNESLF